MDPLRRYVLASAANDHLISARPTKASPRAKRWLSVEAVQAHGSGVCSRCMKQTRCPIKTHAHSRAPKARLMMPDVRPEYAWKASYPVARNRRGIVVPTISQVSRRPAIASVSSTMAREFAERGSLE